MKCSKDGYCYQCDIYQGASYIEGKKIRNVGLATKVVMKLVEEIFNKGHSCS